MKMKQQKKEKQKLKLISCNQTVIQSMDVGNWVQWIGNAMVNICPSIHLYVHLIGCHENKNNNENI